MTLRYLRAFAPALILVLAAPILLGCGSSGGGTTSVSPSPTGQGTAGSTASGRAVWAQKALIDAIVAGQLDPMKAVKTVTVKSNDAQDFYFVGMKFSDASGEQVGVWATQSLDGKTLIWSVNGPARQTTQWPFSTSASGQKLTMATDGAQEAADAVK